MTTAADRGDEFDLPTDDTAAAAAPVKEEEGKAPEKEVAKADVDATDKTDAEGGEEKAEKRIPKNPVPKERLDQEIAKRRAAEQRAAERIQELERQIQDQRRSADVEALESEITKLDEQYDDAIADGEKTRAKEIRAKIRELERKVTRAESAQQALHAKTAAVAELKYDMALSQIEMDYPELNPDDDTNFDADRAQEVADLIDALKRKGNSPDAALRKAVKYVMGPPKRTQEAADKADRDIERDGLRRQREEEARKKVADAAKRTPASTTEAGTDHDKVGSGTGMPSAADIARMRHEQFVKLDEAALRRARGDDL
jgi:hypothetical protein